MQKYKSETPKMLNRVVTYYDVDDVCSALDMDDDLSYYQDLAKENQNKLDKLQYIWYSK